MSDDLRTAAINAFAVLDAIYQQYDRVMEAGGATSISGVAACNSFLTSLGKNRKRTMELVAKPLKKALEENA